ncbi:LacI family transcriptional regulator [Vibrio sp. ZSDZ34]|jgi:LacI family kdg operon repressor|uniref:LacI family transcriptional regulator n=1 Tax=Vibrio gelatinilyticus TaxID=2893468 RepID=A0A9X1WAD4_9VIBR|nr:LacI family DNA-binding transcriptional regulator [Vibrio gelatinilyticus]MCJ2375533.1 LacI family transcriptional regulator [Vibrio gelatinilyticus]
MTKANRFSTISDVAKLAGSGKTSVSRYLNGEKNKLSIALQEQIARAIDELNYQPSQSARMLKAGRSNLIGLVLADITNSYSIEVMKGIEAVCRENNLMLLVCNTDNDPHLNTKSLELLKSHRVDGIIVNTVGMSKDELNSLQSIDTPIVLVDRSAPSLDLDCVGVNNESATQLVGQHLYDLQYKSVLVVTADLVISPRKARVDALKEFAEQHDSLTVKVCEWKHEDADYLVKALQEFYSECKTTKAAIFCTNSVVTLNVVKILQKMGVVIGDEVGLVAFDDPSWCELIGPGITAVRQPTYMIGQSACNTLIGRINNPNLSSKDIQLPATLITRRSTSQ